MDCRRNTRRKFPKSVSFLTWYQSIDQNSINNFSCFQSSSNHPWLIQHQALRALLEIQPALPALQLWIQIIHTTCIHLMHLEWQLSTLLFDGRGYQGWKRSVLIALSAKNKLGFITGLHSVPASDSSDLQPWSRCNDMVTSWLLNSFSKEIADSVIYSRTAKDLWTSLEHRFGQSNGAKLYHLGLVARV
uniref:Putative ovule protein n=1 Tax=Solanum chacoense TaxID=4108 RepID=A0A0V0H736_SOLCH